MHNGETGALSAPPGSTQKARVPEECHTGTWGHTLAGVMYMGKCAMGYFLGKFLGDILGPIKEENLHPTSVSNPEVVSH